jgi:KRAB domain-containing zinc finger protein
VKLDEMCYTLNVGNKADNSEDSSGIACQFCSALLPSRNYMRDHVSQQHPPDFLCEMSSCHMRFRSQQLLDDHMMKHSDEDVKNVPRNIIQRLKPKTAKYMCCKLAFPSKESFNSHQRIYTCNKCNSVLTTRSGIMYHIKQHIAHLKCLHCSKMFISNKKYKLHKNICNAGTYDCTECNKKCHSKRKYDIHCRRIHNYYSYKFVCSMCGKNLKTNSLLLDHERKHKGETPFTCDFCKKSFTSRGYIHAHINFIHLAFDSHQCNVCGKKFKIKQYLQIHMRSHNPDAKRFICKFCDAKFLFKVLLNKHLRTHVGVETLIKCEICNKDFSTQSTYMRHKKLLHSTIKLEKKHKCSQCTKSFFQKDKLERHILTHTGEQPHCCEVCGRKFAQMSQLHTHKIMIHKIMPYECNKCDEKFRIKSDLLSHLTLH